MEVNEDVSLDSSSSSLMAEDTSLGEAINIIVCPTTGGQFEIEMCLNDSIENLRKKIARHVQTPHERLRVIFKEKVLTSGKISQHSIQDGSRLTILPSVESGFSSTVQGTQQSIIQAIESLSDVQIDDFLSGRSPLTLALRVGDHMMFVQLQLEQSMAQANQTLSASSSSNPTAEARQSPSRSHRHPRFYNQLHRFSQHCAANPSKNTALMNGMPAVPLSVPTVPSSSVPSGNKPEAVAAKSTRDAPKRAACKAGNDVSALSAVGGATNGLLYKSPTGGCSSLKRASVASLPQMPVEKTSHLDRLVTACSSLGVSSSTSTCATTNTAPHATPSPSVSNRLLNAASPTLVGSQPTSSLANNVDSKVKSNDASQNYQYRRASTTCGKITSGVGSLTHHGSSTAGARVVRQMQRLRRLCGAHQQCVAYSSRELATEISSIVHAAKHHSASESGSSSSYHRRSGKCSQRERPRAPSSSPVFRGNANAANQVPAAGASIDSVTTHGPGIFSGTFSGSLHPNIQDQEGRPKRDPQTILQILTDLLSATNQYEGQTGNIGMLPQLFKEHFNKQQSNAPPANEQASQKPRPSQPRSHHHHPYHQAYHQHHGQYHRAYGNYPSSYMSGSQPGMASSYAAYQQMVANCKDAYGGSNHSNNGILIPPDNCGHNHRVSGKCPHGYGGHPSGQAGSSSCWKCWCTPSGSRRAKRQAPNINVPRLKQLQQENCNTRQKVQKLQERMQLRRMRRQIRRQACGPYSKRNGASGGLESIGQDKLNELNGEASTVGDSSSSLDVQIDDLSDYADERKSEVTHESPETVTV